MAPADMVAAYQERDRIDASGPTFVEPGDEESWLASRDPDGSIRTDLETVGLHDAQQISHIDEGALLTMRLTAHGLDATHDLFPGHHESFDKLDHMATYIREVLADR